MIHIEQNVLNSNIPNLKLKVRRSWMTKDVSDDDTYDSCYAFGIQSISGKILTFHIITEYGMVRSRVPISQLFFNAPINDIPSHFKQLWDCFGENVTVLKYSYLADKRCKVILKDKTIVWATYLFTVDWFNNPYSDEPTDYKCGHILKCDEGYLLCQPNNRIYWKDSNFVTKDFPIDPRNFKVDEFLESVESASDKWVSEDSNSFYYDMVDETENLTK